MRPIPVFNRAKIVIRPSKVILLSRETQEIKKPHVDHFYSDVVLANSGYQEKYSQSYAIAVCDCKVFCNIS